jgi:DNA ligase D-like protein (predicted ligase)
MRRLYKPMLAKTAESPFSSKDWIYEVKWDGIRAISYVSSDFSIKSRNDVELAHNFPELEELRELAPNTVLDGELVVIKNGKADFQALLERNRTAPAQDFQFTARSSPVTYIVFDILEKQGKTLIDLSLSERKRILRESVKEGKHVTLSVYVEEKGEDYYEAALQRGVEGIMAKKKSSPYLPGIRSENWLKIKKLLSCDCVIFGYTKGEGNREKTFGALILGLYDSGRPVYVGKVGTGFSDKDLEVLTDAFQQISVQGRTLQGVDVPEKITWLKPELVCEVAYQMVTKDGRLRMPRFHVLRTDKKPSECTFDQLAVRKESKAAPKGDSNA